MGRHSAPVEFDAPSRPQQFDGPHPITDPLLLPVHSDSRSQTFSPQSRQAAVARSHPAPVPVEVELAANEVVRQHRQAVQPRPVAPVQKPLPIASSPRPAVPFFTDGPTGIAPRLVAATLSTAPIPARLHTGPITTAYVVEPVDDEAELPRSLGRRRSAALAACAIAVLGAVSTAAAIMPTTHSAAAAEGRCVANSTQPRPSLKPLRHGGHTKAWRLAHAKRSAAAAAPAAVTATTAAASASSTPSASASASASPSATASASESPTASSSPSASTDPSTTPSQEAPAPTAGIGSGITEALSSVLGGIGGSIGALGAGTFTFSNFTTNSHIGYFLGQTGINGAGIDKTVLEMKPHTSTRSGLVPTARGTTNQLSLLQVAGSVHLSNFTLRSTEQGHLYNGLRINQATNARVSNVKVTGVPGDDHMPPGETFGINDWRTTGSVYSGVEVDGAGVGAAGFGANSSKDVTIRDSYFHNNPHSIGATFWQTNGITLEDVRSTNNYGGINFERVSGSVKIVRPVLGNNSDSDLSFGSDQASAKVTIIDPKIVSGSKLRIRIYGSYNGPNKQLRSDIKVLVNGVDRTADLVKWT